MITYEDLLGGRCGNGWQTVEIPQSAQTKVCLHFKDSQGNDLDLRSADIILAGECAPEPCPPPPYAGSSSLSSPSSCSPFLSSWSVSSGYSSAIPEPTPEIDFDPAECMQVRMAMYDGYRCGAIFDVLGTILDAATGHVEFDLLEEHTQYGGIFYGHIGLFQNQKLLRFNTILIEVQPNVWGVALENTNRTVSRIYPITIGEVRMALRDHCPEANHLLEEKEYTNAEILWAIRRPIDYWNESLPPVGSFSPNDFPFRYHHLQAACAELLIMASRKYDRDHLQYTAGGVSIDDKDKGPIYYARGMELKQEWAEWVSAKKIALNIEGGFGTHLSPYSFRWRY